MCPREQQRGQAYVSKVTQPSTVPSLPTDAHSTPQHVTQVVESEFKACSVPERGKRDHYDGLQCDICHTHALFSMTVGVPMTMHVSTTFCAFAPLRFGGSRTSDRETSTSACALT